MSWEIAPRRALRGLGASFPVQSRCMKPLASSDCASTRALPAFQAKVEFRKAFGRLVRQVHLVFLLLVC